MTQANVVTAAAVAVALAAGAVPACGRRDAHAMEPVGRPYVATIVLRDPRDVVIYGVRRFRVLRPVTLRGFAPSVLPEGVTVLAARASFLKSATGRLTPNGYPGAFCTDTWPMRGFGPTYDIDGLDVAAGDVVAFILYVRAGGPGKYAVDGYDLRYDDAGRTRSLGRPSGERADVHVLAPGERAPARPCNGSVRDIWMGPTLG